MLQDPTLTMIAKALETNTTLRQLDLSANLFREEGITTFAQALKINSTLEDLNFSKNNIGEAAKAFAEGIMKNKSLKILNLCGTKGLSKIGRKQLIHMLAANPPLQYLNLNEIGIAEEESKELPKAIKVRFLNCFVRF